MKPLVCILDASVGVTGALVAARRGAELLRDRARFILIVPEEFDAPESETAAFERVVRLAIRPLRRSVGSALGYLPALLRSGRDLKTLLKETGCECLQVNDFYLAEAWVARWLGYEGRITTWVRIDPLRFGRVGRVWMAWARSASNAMVGVSQFIRSRVPEGIEVEVIYDPACTAKAVVPTGQRFLFVGNYTRGKGQDVAINAFHQLAGDYPGATLALYGDTLGLDKNAAYRNELEILAAEGAGASQVEVGGYMSNLGALYIGSLAAINCSESESFSLTCQDACAHGLPVIATRCGGPEEIVEDDVTGLLVPIGDVAAVEKAMRRLLNEPILARTMGTKAHTLMQERFSEARFVDQVSAVLGL